MAYKDILIALLVTALWGFNIVAMKIGVQEVPPILFVAARSLIAITPLFFLIPKPKISWTMILAIGFFIGIGQFLCMALGLSLGMGGSLTSLVFQSQAFFTVILAVILLKERLVMIQVFGMLVSLVGIAIIGIGESFKGSLWGLLFILASAASCGISNVLLRKEGKKDVNMMHLMVWMSLVPPLPLLGYAFYIDGFLKTVDIFKQASFLTYSSILYSGLISGITAFSLWGYLLKRNAASKVVPFAMLAPVFAASFSIPIFQEHFTLHMIAGALCVGLGLIINQFGPKFSKSSRPLI